MGIKDRVKVILDVNKKIQINDLSEEYSKDEKKEIEEIKASIIKDNIANLKELDRLKKELYVFKKAHQKVRPEAKQVIAMRISRLEKSIAFYTEITSDFKNESVDEDINESKTPDVQFRDYSFPEFLKLVKEIEDNGTMNMYVGEAISKKVSSVELEKEITKAIKQHRKMGDQRGSSHLHSGVVMAMSKLLAELRKSVKRFQDIF